MEELRRKGEMRGREVESRDQVLDLEFQHPSAPAANLAYSDPAKRRGAASRSRIDPLYC
jgi:hypothetical protein